MHFRDAKKHVIFPVLFVCWSLMLHAQNTRNLDHFIATIDTIRQKLKIPGLAAAVMKGDSILFAKGFGYSDLKKQVKATENTTFRVASVTKTFTSTLIMQLVEQGKLDINAPVSEFGLDFGNPAITVKNLLTHTSEYEAGTHYQYNGYRYGRLGPVIEKTSGLPFYQLLMERIVQPLGMTATAPGISLFNYFTYIQQRKDMQPFFENAFNNLAKPYEVGRNGAVVESAYLDEFGAFGGLVTNVKDLLKYSAAIDRHQFLPAQTQEMIFTPNRTKDGTITPYGLGWFTEKYRGVDFYWHYGQTQGESALFLKVPSRQLTFVVLANTDKLSQPFPLGDGDLFTSPLGQLFYKYFINEDKNLLYIDYNQSPALLQTLFSHVSDTYIEFYNKEIVTQAVMNIFNGDTARGTQLFKLYAAMNFKHPLELPSEPVISALKEVTINSDISKTFNITAPTRVRIYGVGENCSGDFSSWCDYGWIEDSSGKITWQMQGHPASHAGGAVKNQRVDTVITLQPGTYKLHYKSDGGHAFNNWDSAPPDHFFWGIILFRDTRNKTR